MNRIKTFYKLSKILPINLLPTPLVSSVSLSTLNSVYTAKQSDMYLRKTIVDASTIITIKENVIGGAKNKVDIGDMTTLDNISDVAESVAESIADAIADNIGGSSGSDQPTSSGDDHQTSSEGGDSGWITSFIT